MLGFRGHFLTKSRRYSTTFRVIRGDRRVVNDWHFHGASYRDDAERELAAGFAQRIRDDRKRTYHRENQP